MSVSNAQNIAVNATQAALLAIALAILLGAGELDLSVGANVVLSSVAGASVVQGLDSPAAAAVLGLAACLGTGVALGLLNGVVVAYVGVNSLIATLGTLGIAQGTALLVPGGADIGNLPLGLQDHFGLATVAGIPVPALVAGIVAAIAWAAMRYTRFGVHTLAVGSSRGAAVRRGLRVERHVLALFVIAGGLCGIAGFIDIARFASTTVAGHQLDALAAITAVVIGGGALAGGRVSIPGAVLGALLIVVLQVGLVVVGLDPFWQLIAVGAVLIAAVTLERVETVRRGRSRRAGRRTCTPAEHGAHARERRHAGCARVPLPRRLQGMRGAGEHR